MIDEEVKNNGWKGWDDDIDIVFDDKKALKVDQSSDDEDLVGYADGNITEENNMPCEYDSGESV